MSVPIDGGGDHRHPDLQAAFCATLVDEWVRSGVTHAVVCPGSRSAPMAVALAEHRALSIHVRLDERSAAFTALGIGAALGVPAVVLTTSGTAAAELHPAIVEADLGGIPLLAVTADRPPELRDVGAPQTIDQTRLFGRATRCFLDPGVPDLAGRVGWRSVASRAFAEATAGPRGPGPVHLNLPFREPLLGRPDRGASVPPGRSNRRPWHQQLSGPVPPPDGLVGGLVRSGVLSPSRRGVIVAGSSCGGGRQVLAMAAALGWPVLADPRSGLRCPHDLVVATADAILHSGRFRASHRPDVVVRLGRPWASKMVNGFLAEAVDGGAESIAVDPSGRWVDPERQVATTVRCDPAAFARAVSRELDAVGSRRGEPDGPGIGPWAGSWRTAENAAESVLRRLLGSGEAARPDGRGQMVDVVDAGWAEPLCELAVCARVFALVPGDASIVVSSSMPVRDLESVALRRDRPPRVMANRGANGIDGVVSTALGVALGSRRATVAIVGDLAFLHDVSALVRAPGEDAPLTVVVVDNKGGGIFSFLEQAAALPPSRFELLFGTPQATDVVSVASGFGWPVSEVGGSGDDDLDRVLDEAVAGGSASVVRVTVPDRWDNVDRHARTNATAAHAVDAALSLD
ncbi:MAG: 2-succinyl-5-enolpyruvyl-6-hydroxy-3-cyclohexene-1-carboxylic-acid synthase [Acidimicrobiales bacterium]